MLTAPSTKLATGNRNKAVSEGDKLVIQQVKGYEGDSCRALGVYMGGTPQPALGRARSEKVDPQEKRTSRKVAGPGWGCVWNPLRNCGHSGLGLARV